jgi:hypothetical protein
VGCIHHWKLTSPNGPLVHGACKHCGAEREFPTSSNTIIWDELARRTPRATVLEPGTATSAEIIRAVWQ